MSTTSTVTMDKINHDEENYYIDDVAIIKAFNNKKKFYVSSNEAWLYPVTVDRFDTLADIRETVKRNKDVKEGDIGDEKFKYWPRNEEDFLFVLDGDEIVPKKDEYRVYVWSLIGKKRVQVLTDLESEKSEVVDGECKITSNNTDGTYSSVTLTLRNKE